MAQIRDISKRTALYERLSKDDEQQGESNSILNQKQYLEEYAHKNGFVNIQHFTDDGYTGQNFNRPGFQEMLAEIENGKIGTVIVKDMSRFGRNYLQVGFYTEMMFPQKQVRFIAINNSVDSDKPQDNDFTPFLNIMNEWYAKDTSNKIKSIFLSRMNDGKRCSGSIPYGYNRLPGDKQTLVVDPVASKVVKHIFALAADGYNPPTIAKKLTEEEVLIPSAYTLQYHPEQCNRKSEWGCTRWNPTTVRDIFPKKYLQKCGIKESGMYNQIANYVYTQSEINIKIKDQAPKEYMAQVKEQCTGVNAVCGGIDSFFMATIVAAPVPNRWRWNAVRTY